MIAFIGGCGEDGLISRTEAGAPGDARASEAAVVEDSRPPDNRPIVDGDNDTGPDVGDDTADRGDTANGDSGPGLDVIGVVDAPPSHQDVLADSMATTIDGEDSGRLGPSSVEVGTSDVDRRSEAGVESDGPSPDQAEAWACNAPACWAELMQDCQPAGTCRQRLSGETSNRCYANGIKVLATVHGVASMLTTVKNGTKVCFEIVFDMTSGASVGFIRNGNGSTVATITDAPSGRSAIACVGHDAVVLNEACDSLPWVADACESGDCDP